MQHRQRNQQQQGRMVVTALRRTAPLGRMTRRGAARRQRGRQPHSLACPSAWRMCQAQAEAAWGPCKCLCSHDGAAATAGSGACSRVVVVVCLSVDYIEPCPRMHVHRMTYMRNIHVPVFKGDCSFRCSGCMPWMSYVIMAVESKAEIPCRRFLVMHFLEQHVRNRGRLVWTPLQVQHRQSTLPCLWAFRGGHRLSQVEDFWGLRSGSVRHC